MEIRMRELECCRCYVYVVSSVNRPVLSTAYLHYYCGVCCECERRQLLEQVSAFEQAEFAGDASSQTVRPAPLRLNSFDARLSDTQRIVSLSLVR